MGKLAPLSGVFAIVVFVILAKTVGGEDPPQNPARTETAAELAPTPLPAVSAPVEQPRAAPPVAVSPPVSVSPEQLRKEYGANEISADEKYLGRALLVTGIVGAVRKDWQGTPYVELATSNEFTSVYARFADGASGPLGTFKRGDKLMLRCIGNNVMIGSPQLKDCALDRHYRRGTPGTVPGFHLE